jgi:hypothetical protein
MKSKLLWKKYEMLAEAEDLVMLVAEAENHRNILLLS